MEVVTLKTNLKGLKRNYWRRNLNGFFSCNGKPMTDAQVRRMINWGIEHGCVTEADIPEDKVAEILREPTRNDTQTKLFNYNEVQRTMKWEYKKHTIEVNEAGFFIFKTADGIQRSCSTLSEAESAIDEFMAEYYNITQEQYKQLLKKLTDREKDFVKSMVEELHNHENNAYCELGLRYFDFTLPEIE